MITDFEGKMKDLSRIIKKLEKKLTVDEISDLISIDGYVKCLELQVKNYQHILEKLGVSTGESDGKLEKLKCEMRG